MTYVMAKHVSNEFFLLFKEYSIPWAPSESLVRN